MRNAFLWIAVCVTAMVAAPMLSSAALVSINNPGFESGDLTGWTESGSGNGAVAYSTVPCLSGWSNYFAKVGYAANGSLTQVLDGNGNDTVTLTAGNTYKLSVQVGRPGSCGWSQEIGFRIVLKAAQSDAALVVYDFFTYGGEDLPNLIPEDGWIEAVLEYTAEAGDPYLGENVSIALEHWGATGAGVYDEVQLDVSAAPAVAHAVMVNNPGFETGDLTGWTLVEGNPTKSGAQLYSGVTDFSGWSNYFGYVGYAEPASLEQILDGTDDNEEVTFAAGNVYSLAVQVGRAGNDSVGWSQEYGFRVTLKAAESNAALVVYCFYTHGGHYATPHLVDEYGWLKTKLQYTVEDGDPYIGQHPCIVLEHTWTKGCGIYDEVTFDVLGAETGIAIVIR